MNIEQRIRLMQEIKRTEGLLAWDKQHQDRAEVSRLEELLKRLIEQI